MKKKFLQSYLRRSEEDLIPTASSEPPTENFETNTVIMEQAYLNSTWNYPESPTHKDLQTSTIASHSWGKKSISSRKAQNFEHETSQELKQQCKQEHIDMVAGVGFCNKKSVHNGKYLSRILIFWQGKKTELWMLQRQKDCKLSFPPEHDWQ